MRQSPKVLVINVWQLILNYIWLIPGLLLLKRYFEWLPIWWVAGLIITLRFGLMVAKFWGNRYEYERDTLIVRRGLLQEEIIKLPVGEKQQISNFRLKETFLHKLLRVQGITIYLKNSEEDSEINFGALNKEEVLRLRSFLLLGSEEIENANQKQSIMQIKHKALILSTFFSMNYVYAIPFFLDWSGIMGRIVYGRIADLFTSHNRILVGFVALMGMLIWTIGYQYFSFGKFSLAVNDDCFVTSNGWLDADQNIINQKDIIGVKVTRNIGQRMLGLGSIEVMLANELQGQSTTTNMLLPHQTLKEIEEFINKYLPKYRKVAMPERLINKSFLRQICSYIIYTLGITGGYLIISAREKTEWSLTIGSGLTLTALVIGILIGQWLVVTRLIRFSNVYVIEGGIINKRYYLIPRDKVVAVENLRCKILNLHFKRIYLEAKNLYSFSALH